MGINYLFNEYSKEIVHQMAMGTNGMYPPHLMLEVHYTPAYAHPQDAGYCIRQMGTQSVLACGYKTRGEAITGAIHIAKQMLPNGIVFERVADQ